MPDSWYETTSTEQTLLQGDLVQGCPTLTLPTSLADLEAGQIQTTRILRNAIIMTQSCDLASKGADTVLLCPYYPFKQWIQRSSGYRNQVGKGEPVKNLVTKELEALAEGRRVLQHLLNRDDSAGITDYLVVELNAAFSIHRSVITELIARQQTRTRLRSPYREHLSQAYARVFMRVGLPENISSIADSAYYEPDATLQATLQAAFKAQLEAAKAAKQAARPAPESE